MADATPQPVIVAVIGSRSYHNYAQLAAELDKLALTTPIASLVSGAANGADTMAERYAQERGLAIEIVRPDYARYGRRAPLVRNIQIVKLSKLVVAFHDGVSKGTAHALKQARLLGLPIITVEPEQPTLK